MNSSQRIDSIIQLLEKEPNDSFLNYALSLEYHKSGRTEEAINLIEKLLLRDDSYLGAYLQLGKMYEEQLKPEKALSTYQKACTIAKLQNNNKALSELEEAIFFLED